MFKNKAALVKKAVLVSSLLTCALLANALLGAARAISLPASAASVGGNQSYRGLNAGTQTIKASQSVTPVSAAGDNQVSFHPVSNASDQPAVETSTPPPTPDTYNVNEQFSGSTLNGNLWHAMSYPKGYRNSEEEDYSPSQVSVSNGNLRITAARDSSGNWHSGEVDSRWNYTYGEFEVKLALSTTGQGVWPAAWLLGATDPWPYDGEIDIFENINGQSLAYGTIHGGGGSSGGWWIQKVCSNINVTQFHTYKIIKQPGYMSWYVDGSKCGEWFQSQTPPGGSWPFETHSNIGILNLAIGGAWPGPSNASTPSTINMYIDYFTVKNAS